MILLCKNCKKKFYLHNDGTELEGKVIECKFCSQKWLYESKTKYLENRLVELNNELDNTVSKINLRKKEYQDKINQLEDDLQKKKMNTNYKRYYKTKFLHLKIV
tara:strand:- start:608 stop:919 length:312 start_codon:yes stop_codon:yes gene_type:complete